MAMKKEGPDRDAIPMSHRVVDAVLAELKRRRLLYDDMDDETWADVASTLVDRVEKELGVMDSRDSPTLLSQPSASTNPFLSGSLD